MELTQENIKPGDIVSITIKSIDNLGYLVNLKDYQNNEGFILDCSNKKDTKYNVNSIHRAKIVRLDYDKKYVDLEFIKPKKILQLINVSN